jgi:hypothetical protein
MPPLIVVAPPTVLLVVAALFPDGVRALTTVRIALRVAWQSSEKRPDKTIGLQAEGKTQCAKTVQSQYSKYCLQFSNTASSHVSSS